MPVPFHALVMPRWSRLLALIVVAACHGESKECSILKLSPSPVVLEIRNCNASAATPISLILDVTFELDTLYNSTTISVRSGAVKSDWTAQYSAPLADGSGKGYRLTRDNPSGLWCLPVSPSRRPRPRRLRRTARRWPVGDVHKVKGI